MQSLWLLFWLLSPVLQSQAISSAIIVIFRNNLPFFLQNAYTLRANEALYQPSTYSIHVIHTLETIIADLWFHLIGNALINLNLTLIIISEIPTQKYGIDKKK